MNCNICGIDKNKSIHNSILSGLDRNDTIEEKCKFIISWINFYINNDRSKHILETVKYHHNKLYDTVIKLMVLM
jgi:hypothetical protein